MALRSWLIFALGLALSLPAAAAKHDKRRQPEPCPPPPPCAKPTADKNYEIRITSLDAGAAVLPIIETVLNSTSNRDDQRSRLQAQISAGGPILHIVSGPPVRVPQEDVRTSDSADCQVTARPHLNAHCAEAVDIFIEQHFIEQHTGTKCTVLASGSLVFENGDTQLISRTLNPDGTYHLLYATVFFPPYEPAIPVCQ